WHVANWCWNGEPDLVWIGRAALVRAHSHQPRRERDNFDFHARFRDRDENNFVSDRGGRAWIANGKNFRRDCRYADGRVRGRVGRQHDRIIRWTCGEGGGGRCKGTVASTCFRVSQETCQAYATRRGNYQG